MFDVPLPSLDGFFVRFFFWPDICFFLYFLGYLGLKGTPYFRWREKKNVRKRLGRGALSTCAKFHGRNLKNGVDIWTLVRLLSAKITAWYLNCLVLFSIYSILGVKFDLLVLRSQFFNFLRETLYTHTLEHLEAAGPQKIKVISYLLLTSLKVCDWSGQIFGASASPRSLTKKTGY